MSFFFGDGWLSDLLEKLVVGDLQLTIGDNKGHGWVEENLFFLCQNPRVFVVQH